MLQSDDADHVEHLLLGVAVVQQADDVGVVQAGGLGGDAHGRGGRRALRGPRQPYPGPLRAERAEACRPGGGPGMAVHGRQCPPPWPAVVGFPTGASATSTVKAAVRTVPWWLKSKNSR